MRKTLFYRYMVAFVAMDLEDLTRYANTSIVSLSCRYKFWSWHPVSLHHALIMVGNYCFSMFSKGEKAWPP